MEEKDVKPKILDLADEHTAHEKWMGLLYDWDNEDWAST